MSIATLTRIVNAICELATPREITIKTKGVLDARLYIFPPMRREGYLDLIDEIKKSVSLPMNALQYKEED